MAFFRIKKIKGKEYAYIVENKWKPTAKSVELNASSRDERERAKRSRTQLSREHLTLRGIDMRGSRRDSLAMSKPRGSRQKVKEYVGRVYRFNLMNNVNFLEYFKIEDVQNYIEINQKNKIINDLIEWELYKFNVNKNEFSIDLNSKKIQKNNKNVAFFINEGFMCDFTLKNLLEFKPEGDEQADGYRLARAFVEAGIKVPQEIFIGVFGKLYKTAE
ncbi:hypothetical protein J4448_05365 [Candidatus Woesearchaeota archaeon]|nr:hypothetical protein [Candidatus Woesearchaeota archaeon]